jgi:hypothetical protein
MRTAFRSRQSLKGEKLQGLTCERIAFVSTNKRECSSLSTLDFLLILQ